MQPSKPLRRPSLHQLRSANRRPLQYCGNERQKRQSRWLAVAARKRRPKKYGSHVSPNLLSAVPTFTHTSANEALPLGHKVRRRNHPGALDSGAFAAQLATTPAVSHSLQPRGRRLSEYSCSVTNKQISVCVVLAFRASLGRVGGITHSSQPLHECISLSPYRSLSCSGPTHVKPFSRPANHPHGRRCHSHHSAAPTAALHSPPQHQVVLHMYQPTVLNSLVLETLPMAALNNLPPRHLSTLWHTFAIGWSSFLKQNGRRILYAVFATPCAS